MKFLISFTALFSFFLLSCGRYNEMNNKIICDSLSAYLYREWGVQVDTILVLDKKLITEKEKLQMNLVSLENYLKLKRYPEKIKMDSEIMGDNINHLEKYEKMWNGTTYSDFKVSKEDSEMYYNYCQFRWHNEYYKESKNKYDSFLHLYSDADSVNKNHYICLIHAAYKGYHGENIADVRFYLDNHYKPFFLWQTVKQYAHPDSNVVWCGPKHSLTLPTDYNYPSRP